MELKNVFPIPESAPTVMDSMHINICDSPKTVRYWTPIGITSVSWMNNWKIGFAPKIRRKEQNVPQTNIQAAATKYPFCTRSYRFPPKFCPAKELIDAAKPSAVIQEMDSIWEPTLCTATAASPHTATNRVNTMEIPA